VAVSFIGRENHQHVASHGKTLSHNNYITPFFIEMLQYDWL